MLINQRLGEKLSCSTLIKYVLAAITKIHLHFRAFLRKVMHLGCIKQRVMLGFCWVIF